MDGAYVDLNFGGGESVFINEPTADVIEKFLEELSQAVVHFMAILYATQVCIACCTVNELAVDCKLPRKFHSKTCEKYFERADLAGGGLDSVVVGQMFCDSLVEEFLEHIDFEHFMRKWLATFCAVGGNVSLYTRKFFQNEQQVVHKIKTEWKAELLHKINDLI